MGVVSASTVARLGRSVLHGPWLTGMDTPRVGSQVSWRAPLFRDQVRQECYRYALYAARPRASACYTPLVSALPLRPPPPAQTWWFECNAWLSSTEDDRCLERLLKASLEDPAKKKTQYKVRACSHTCAARVLRGFTAGHMRSLGLPQRRQGAWTWC